MEKQFNLQLNGQELQQQDVNLIGETSGLADDRVFAELFRLTPYDGTTVVRGVLPYGKGALVAPNGASGSILVNPFRAILGSRTAVATEAQKNWRDIRSGLSVAEGATALTQSLNLFSNSSGFARWDLIYATVTPDANSATVTRKQKNPTTKVISDQTVAVSKVTTVTVGVATGTASATPDWPALPADGGGSYYIALAYIRVPNGFNNTSTVATTDIAVQAPIIALSETAGGNTVGVADQQYKQAGSVLTSAVIHSWGSTGSRPTVWLPPSMSGGASLLVAVDALSVTASFWSHQDLDIVDSRDWRYRAVRFWGAVEQTTFSWNGSDGNSTPKYSESTQGLSEQQLAVGFGHTFHADTHGGGVTPDVLAGHSVVAMVGGASITADASMVYLLCDMTTGKLKVHIPGVPRRSCFFWLDFSGVLRNL